MSEYDNESQSQQPQTVSSTVTEPFNADGILALSQTKDEIESFKLDLLGLKRVKIGKSYVIERKGKPTFTFEFVNLLINGIYKQVNIVTTRSTINEEYIRRYNLIYNENLINLIATEGMRCFVPDEAYHIIKKYDFKKNHPTVYFNYHEPWGNDVLNIIKQYHPEIFKKSNNENVIFNIIWSQVAWFIHLGRNRALNALTLDHEKMVHKETVVNAGIGQQHKQSGMLSRLRNMFTGE